MEALPEGGTVLDVGCGPGAASLPLANRASLVAGVDTDARLLGEFESRATSLGVRVITLQGRWPDIADRAPAVDLVVCHHVAYNVPDLGEFALRLTEKARSRVVMELTLVHPRAYLNDLWMHFHKVPRPERPNAFDANAVLREAGLKTHMEEWTPTVSGTWFATLDEAVAWTARALCLNSDHYPELRSMVEPELIETDGMFAQRPRPRATIWWDGQAS
jgi:SAM-dependent methyltransferase